MKGIKTEDNRTIHGIRSAEMGHPGRWCTTLTPLNASARNDVRYRRRAGPARYARCPSTEKPDLAVF
jgi:hypothetical protein